MNCENVQEALNEFFDGERSHPQIKKLFIISMPVTNVNRSGMI